MKSQRVEKAFSLVKPLVLERLNAPEPLRFD